MYQIEKPIRVHSRLFAAKSFIPNAAKPNMLQMRIDGDGIAVGGLAVMQFVAFHHKSALNDRGKRAIGQPQGVGRPFPGIAGHIDDTERRAVAPVFADANQV